MSTKAGVRGIPELSVLNSNRQTLSGPEYLDQLLSSQDVAAKALVFVDADGVQVTFTYKQVQCAALCLAVELRGRFNKLVDGKTVIPVILPQHPALYISYLAVLKLGAAFCPITPDTPWERIAFIVNDVSAKLVICQPQTHESLQKQLPEAQCHSVHLEPLLSGNTSLLEPVSRQPSDTAYVMYTSGSTGKPKGVPVSHSAVCQSLLAHDEHIPSFKRFLQFAAPTFDVSIFEIFFPWFRGSTLVSCEREKLLADLPGIINTLDVDAAELTPTVISSLIRHRAAVPNLKLLLTIGEMLTKNVVTEFGGAVESEGILYAMYGPTEAAIHCTIVPKMSSDDSVHNIGRPLATVAAFILDESADTENKVLELGEIGELAVAGQLADGYLNRKDQTSVAFVHLPNHGIVYKTGDRARMTKDEQIHILGRIVDGQVKVRGQRVELGEIEAAASQTEGVIFSIAMLIDGVLVLVCSGDSSLQTSSIESACRKWLPLHMRPGRIVIMSDDLPKLPSGKVDRNRLKHMSRTQPRDNYDECASPSTLHQATCEELSCKVHPDAPLRHYGMDSLRAISLASRLKRHYPSISVSSILEAESIRDLELSLKHTTGADYATPETTTTPDVQETIAKVLDPGQYSYTGLDIERVIPCTSMQIAMLVETSQNHRVNMNEIVLEYSSSRTFQDIVTGFIKIAKDNAILRTSFETTSDVEMPFVQLIRRSASFVEEASLANPIQLEEGPTPHTIRVTIHHAIYDGWSWDVIVNDLDLLLRGQPILCRPSYTDYVYQRRAELSLHSQEDLTFWVDNLRSARPSKLPVLTSMIQDKFSRLTYASKLSVSETNIRQAAQSLDVGTPVVVHSSLVLLLSTLTDTTDITTGLVVAGRDPIIADVEHLIGPTLSTLPVLASIDKSETSRQLMLDVHRKHMDCLRHSRVSLGQIKSALNLSSDESLFDVIFAWQQSLYSNAKCVDADIKTQSSRDYLPQALIVEVEPLNDHLQLKSTFDPSRISESQIEMLHKQIDNMLQLLATDIDTPIRDIWSRIDQTSLSLFEPRTAKEQPDDIALLFGQMDAHLADNIAIEIIKDYNPSTRTIERQTLTYQQLNSISRCSATVLRNQFRLRKNELVAIQSKKCLALYTTICAIIRAGLAYLCVDPDIPNARLIEILVQSKPALLLVEDPDLLMEDEMTKVPLMSLNEFASRKCYGSDIYLPKVPHTDLAYTVFTSGSTGIPKGVLITRGNLMSNIQYLASIYPHVPSSKLLQSCSPAFDVSVFEIFWTWYCGLTLCSAVNDVLFRDIESFVNMTAITHLSMTPSVAALVDPKSVPKIEFLVCSGEPMTAKVFKAWQDRGLYQGYGPSETTNICNVRHYREVACHINNVGPAFPNTSLFACDRLSEAEQDQQLNLSHFRLVPSGGVGEVWIGGQQVGRGYTDSVLTSRSWLDHPTHGRLYRSGDIGRLLADNSLIILGREDDQTKIRGLRIELNEINTRLLQLDIVADACAIIVSEGDTHQRLLAFWVPQSRSSRDLTPLLFNHLQQTLSSYMVPELLIQLETMPLTQQKKVDRKQLRAIYLQMSQEQKSAYAVSKNQRSVAEESEEAKTVVKALSELTTVPEPAINLYASFFSYGIDSIGAIALARRLRDRGLEQVDVSSIMRHSSVASLLAHIQIKKPSTPCVHNLDKRIPENVRARTTKMLEEQCHKVVKVLPCTSLQEAMLSTYVSSGDSSYLNHLAFRLYIEADRLEAAWRHVQRRHEILRTVFAVTEDIEQPFVQIVLEDSALPWLQVEKATSKSVNSPFDVCPYSFQLVQHGKDGARLHLFIHHALYDADALDSLLHEVEALVAGNYLSEPVPFSNYIELAVTQQDDARNEFWRTCLTDVVPCRLTDVVVKQDPTIWLAASIPPSGMTFTKLSQAAKAISTTTLSLCQTALLRLLAHILGRSDVCFGTIFSGRANDASGANRIIGPTFNSLPVRSRLRKNMTNAQVSAIFRKLNADILQYQATPLRQLQREYSSDGRKLFDVLLLLQTPKTTLDPAVWQLEHESGQMDFPFIIELGPDPLNDCVSVQLHSTVMNNQELRGKVATMYLHVLNDTCAKPHALATSTKYLLPKSPPCLTPQTTIVNGKEHSKRPEFGSKNQAILASDVGRAVIDSIKALNARAELIMMPDTSIFELGFDSISAIRLSSRLRSLGYQVSTANILEDPDVGSIIQQCTRAKSATMGPKKTFDMEAFGKQHRTTIISRSNMKHRDVQAIYPCTATQIGILSEYIQSGGKLYANSMKYQLDPAVGSERMIQAWKEIVSRHEILRTGFAEIDDTDIPFAMVVYSKSDKHLSNVYAREAESFISPSSKVLDLDVLLVPPWSVCFVEDDGSNFMELRMLHALYDANALHNLLRDLATAYYRKAFKPIPALTDAIGLIIQENRFTKPDLEFWKQKQPTFQTTKFPDLNIHRAVPSRLCVRIYGVTMSLEAIQQACQTVKCTLSVACQAAWARLLAIYTGQETVAFGTVLSGRSGEHGVVDDVCFPCINTLPIIVDLSDSAPSLLQQVSQTNAQLHKHPQLPLSTVRTTLGVDTPLFDTIFVLQKQLDNSNQMPWTLIDEQASAEYAVSLEAITSGTGLILQMTYDLNVMPPAHAYILLQQYEYLLLETLHMRERERGLHFPLFSMLPPEVPLIPSSYRSLHEMVLTTAARIPDAIAVEYIPAIDGDIAKRQCWTYTQLVRISTRIARQIIGAGAKRGDFVAICFNKCPEASFALLGVLLAGCVYVAVDPSAPASRQQFILQDAKCKVLLTDRSTVVSSENTEDLRILVLDQSDLDNATAYGLTSALPVHVSEGDTCYCLYTSGTTGTPKGCLISHKSVVQAMLSFSRIFKGHWTADSRWLQFAAYHFDVSVVEHFWSWSEGLRVTIAPRDLLFEDLPGTISKLNITHLDLTPSLARLLTPELVPSLCNGVFIVGGEPVRQDIIETWGDAGCLYNFYGPSEVTIGCTVHPRVQQNVKPTNIGQQWDNVGSFVLKPGTEEPVLIGGVGELCLSGILVGQGYLNRPDLTAENFVTLSASGERVYRTGDLVRMLHDGSFEFLARMDDQVKLRGQRLEIGEINHVISKATGLEVAALVAKHPEHNKEHLIAVLARGDTAKSTTAVVQLNQEHETPSLIAEARSIAVDKLPGYMVPTYFVVVNHMPLTVNNKADLKALKQLYGTMSMSEVRKAQQEGNKASSVQGVHLKEFVDILSKLLGVPSSSISGVNSLFQLGVDSISAIALSRKLRTAGYTNASVATILRHAVVNDLVRVIADDKITEIVDQHVEQAREDIKSFGARHKLEVIQTLDVKPAEISYVLPCTPLQQGMISRLVASEAEIPPYLNMFVCRLSDDCDLDTLRKAWIGLLVKHDILRTYFVSTVDGYAQVVWSKIMTDHAVQMVTDLYQEEFQKVVDDYYKDWIRKIRDLGSMLPWAVHFFQSHNTLEKHMAVFMFHGIYDGASVPLLFEALFRLYNDSTPVSVQIPQFHEALPYGPLLPNDGAAEFWRRAIPHIGLLQVDPTNTSMISTHETTITLALVRGVCSALQVTPQAIFEAGWLYTLAQLFNTNLSLGVVLSGRSIDLEGADQIIGPMFNTVPFAVECFRKGSSLKALIETCHQKNIDLLSYQHTSLSSIRKWLKLDPSKDMFNCLFTYQGQMSRFAEVSKYFWVEIQQPQNTPDYPLNVEIEDLLNDHFKIVIASKGILLGDVTIDNIMDTFSMTLATMDRATEKVLPGCLFDTQDLPTDGNQLLEADQANEEDDVHTWAITDDVATIRSVLTEMSGVPEAAIDLKRTTIFELGLDSVDALKLSARLKQRQIVLPVSKILRHPTILGMASECETAKDEIVFDATSRSKKQDQWRRLAERDGINTSNMEVVLPATPMQESLLLDFAKYFNVFVYKVSDGFHAERFIEAIHQTVRDLPVLRTKFLILNKPEDNASFLQLVTIADHDTFNYDKVLRYANEADIGVHVNRIKATADIINSTPQIQLIVTNDDSTYFLLALSHALYDASSLTIIFEHILSLYTNNHYAIAAQGALTIEFIDIARAAISSENSVRFWTTQLDGAIPCNIKRTSQKEAAKLKTKTSSMNPEQLHKLCRLRGVTPQSVGLTVWSLSLMHLTNGTACCTFGVVASGRTFGKSEELVFPTFNTVVFRPHVRPSQSTSELLTSIHELATQVYEHQHFPLSKALRMTKHGAGLFNTLFTFQKATRHTTSFASVLEEVDLENGEISPPPYTLNVEMQETNDTLLWTIAVQEDVMSATEMDALLDKLDFILQFIVEGDDNKAPLGLENKILSVCGLTPIKIEDNLALGDHDNEVHPANNSAMSPQEHAICEVFAMVSDVPKQDIDRTTSLFHLGLDSVSTIRIAKALRERGFKIPVSIILREQTVGAIAAAAGSRQQTMSKVPSNTNHDCGKIMQHVQHMGIAQETVEDILPATGGQAFMLDMWRAGQRQLYATFWYEVRKCSEERFRAAFDKLIVLVPVLRARFVEHHGQYYQVVLRHGQQLGPVQYEVGTNEQGDLYVSLHIHHALYDAMSIDLMMEQLKSLCACLDAPAINTDFRLFVEHTTVQPCQTFWTSYLGPTLSSLAYLDGTFAAKRNSFVREKVLDTISLDTMCREAGISIQCLFFAAIGKLLAQRRGEGDVRTIVLGVYLSNRALDLENLTELIVPTFNVVPLKVDVRMPLLQAATKVQADLSVISEAANCGVSFRDIYAWTGVKLDCYVNFIKLPDNSKTAQASSKEDVAITHATGDARQYAERLGSNNEISPFLNDVFEDQSAEWCQPALDIEAKIDKNDHLTVAMFAPDDMAAEEDLKDMVEEVKSMLCKGEKSRSGLRPVVS